MFKYGTISDVKNGYAKVNFEADKIVSDWWPVLVRRSKSDIEDWQFEINEQVVCLVDEYCNEGVILGAIVNDEDIPDPGEAAGKWRKVFSDGTLLEYDKNAHKLTVDVKGDIDATTTGAAKIDAGTTLDATAVESASVTAPLIELKGNVTVSGTLSAAAFSTIPGTGGDGSMTITGDITLNGKIDATGDIKAGTVSLKTHIHSGVTSGAGTSGSPVP